MEIIILDLGISNLKSVVNAFKKIGVDVSTSDKKKQISKADAYVLPGVGSFDAGMYNVEKNDFHKILSCEVLEKKKPILGICLGMQLLCSTGFENRLSTKGLNFVEGEVVEMKIPDKYLDTFKLPHVGWNDVNIINSKGIYYGIDQKTDYYFIHSYHTKLSNKEIASSYTNNGIDFVSAFEFENIFGVQFHPEKSQASGLKLLENWVKQI